MTAVLPKPIEPSAQRSAPRAPRAANPEIEFLGSKRGLLTFITDHVQEVVAEPTIVADIFCGTGAVSAALKLAGHEVIANDHLTWCATTTEAMLVNNGPPSFTGLPEVVCPSDDAESAYCRVLEALNEVPSDPGFMWRTYSPAAERFDGHKRMYFSEANAAKIDAMRRQIASWTPRLDKAERSLLISDLLRAAAAVSNVAGTYGCYLKSWKSRALAAIELKPTAFVASLSCNHRVHHADVDSFVALVDTPVVYADPPYTKRQYAAYYHILETIALGDEPNTFGSTGLRPWKEKASDFCYKRHAPAALRRLVERVRADHFFMSYNDDGQIPHTLVLEILGAYGRVNVWETPVRRYKSSTRPHKGDEVIERLYHVGLERRIRGRRG